MRVVFMGTPDFAVPCLEALISSGYDVCGVFSQPDKPVGRKQIMTAPAVKVCAESHGITVFQPQSLKADDDAYNTILSLSPDIIVVVAYGKILPKRILDIPKYGCVNVHASLLPKFRGASPVQWSIVSGEKVTGVTTMLLDEGMDTGDILLKASEPINSDDTAESLFSRLSALGATLLIKTLDGLETGKIIPNKQNDEDATYAPIIKKEDALIDWSRPASEIDCLIRGLNSWPTAYTYDDDKRLKIYSAAPVEMQGGEPGQIFTENGKIIVKCGGESALQLCEIQLEGSKRMDAATFLRGRKFSSERF